MAEEEEKLQRIPSWIDSRPLSRPPARPFQSPSRAPSPNGAFQQRQTNVMAWEEATQYQDQILPFLQHPMYMSPRSFMMNPLTAQANMQMAAFMQASADAARGIAVPPVHHWGHLNPNFDFGGGQLEHGVEMEGGEGDAGQPFNAADGAGDRQSTPSPVLTPALSVQRHKLLDHLSVSIQTIQPLLSIDGSGLGQIQPAAPLAGVSTNFDSPDPQPAHIHHGSSLYEAHAFLEKISEDLSDEKQRSSYLPASIAKPTNVTPISIPTGPRPRQPSAPMLMRRWNGRGVSRERTMYLRENTKSRQAQSAKKDSGQGVNQGGVGLPVTPSKRKVGGAEEELPTNLSFKVELADRPGSSHREIGTSTGRDYGRDIARDNSRKPPKGDPKETLQEPLKGLRDTRKGISRSNKSTIHGEGRQQSMAVSSTAQELLSPKRSPTSWAPPAGSISIPANNPNPFFTIDFHEPSKQLTERGKHHERLLETRHRLDFDKIVGYKYITSNLNDKWALGDGWDSEKARMLEKMGDEHWKERVDLEKKLVEDEKEDARAEGEELRRMVEGGEMDIEDVRRRRGLRGVTVGVRLVSTRGSIKHTSGNGRHGDNQVRPSVVHHGREGPNGVESLVISSPSSPEAQPQADPRYAIHYTMLLSSALRYRHERELRWLGDETTAQERAEFMRRQRDEWGEWHTALPLRKAMSRGGRRESGTRRQEEGARSGGEVDERGKVGTGEEGGYREKGRFDGRADDLSSRGTTSGRADGESQGVEPGQISCSELQKFHAQEMKSLEPDTTEQEKKRILRRQEGELVEWHASQLLKRQQAGSRSLDFKLSSITARGKREAVDDAGGGRRRKLVRYDDLMAVETMVPVASLKASTIPETLGTAVGVSAVNLPSDHGATISAKPRGVLWNSSTEGTEKTESACEGTEKNCINESAKIFKLVGNPGITSQDGVLGEGNRRTEDLGSDDETQAIDPVETPRLIQTPLAIQLLGQAIQTSRSSKAYQVPQNGSVTQLTQIPQTVQATRLAIPSPPIAQGEWILDSFLDSLADAPPVVPEASQSPKPDPPSTRFKGLSCVIS